MSQRYEHLVVIMLEPMPKGREFEIWPMHITVVPWFPCDDAELLDRVLGKVAAGRQPFEVKVGQLAEWGGSDKFSVIKIDADWRLLSLHWDIYKSLEKNGFPINQKEYLVDKYTPHITLRNRLTDENLYKNGDIIKIDRFTLVSQDRLKDTGQMIKKLVKDYELG